ncbi:WD40 repeat-like protein [Trichoderma ceciliae]
MVIKEFLDSDRVNFLIWRYLLEGNYRETAAKFQKEWHVREPQRDFDFARHVKGRALVSVVNSGLIYYALEREHARRQMPEDAAAQAEALRNGIFGPLEVQPPAKTEEVDEDAPADEVEQIELPELAEQPEQPEQTEQTEQTELAELAEQAEQAELAELAELSRKRTQISLPNGSPSKRPRLSNGCESKSDAATVSTPMDVDQQDNHHNLDDDQTLQDNHAYPSPLEGEQVPLPIVRTEGPEQGTQVDKVEQLFPKTTFIRLMDADCATETPPSPSPAGTENAPILLQCEWNPTDPSILAAAGTDALARVWTISRATATEDGEHHVSPHAHALLDPDSPKTTTVTALAWTSDGTAIAVASDCGRARAAIHVWSAGGELLQSMDVSEPPIVKLLWNPSNSALLAISPENKVDTLVTVHSATSNKSFRYHLSGHNLDTGLDATWTGDSEFLICGGGTFECLSIGETSVQRTRKFETKEDDHFAQVLFDPRSQLVATSSDKGVLDLWDESGQRRSISAHQGSITTMAWQPLPPNQPSADDERLIATGGEDGAILIWNARQPESRAKCFFTMELPVVRLAFTPDGAFIAGATSRSVLIWKVDSHSVPRAVWRPSKDEFESLRSNQDSEEEDEHCLCWDISGQKLAYGANSRLAIISFSG